MKTPRNAPCPCGSGKKFKKCHEPLLKAAKQEAIVRANEKERWRRLEAEIQRHSEATLAMVMEKEPLDAALP